jgi:hypothetical protein
MAKAVRAQPDRAVAVPVAAWGLVAAVVAVWAVWAAAEV